jgi:HSP20 family protein
VAGITSWTPLREFDALERRVRRMLEDIGFLSALLPAADVYETADEFVVELELAGYEEKELNIEVADDKLKVTGERTEEQEETGTTLRHPGRLDRRFERRFDLPNDVDAGQIKAVFENGLLVVSAPKRLAGASQEVQISTPKPAQRVT